MSKNLLEKLEIKAKMIPFSTKEKLSEGGFINGENIEVDFQDKFLIFLPYTNVRKSFV